MNNKKNVFEMLNFEDEANIKHGLHGHVRVSIKNNETGEVSLWEESDNIIPISGYQTLLLKLFGLHLDSLHNNGITNEKLDEDTNLIIPDLNNNDMMHIGVDPTAYQSMEDNYGADHFVQGFMVGDGGAGEDANTSKNTDYSFIQLRSPIPFQESQSGSLDPSIANKYLGKIRIASSGSQETSGASFYIKKFDDTPHVYHSWYRDGQAWDYVDPINQGDLGPLAANTAKSNRIETYVQCNLSIDSNDCMSYFNATTTSDRTPRINEIGLVAFDTVQGSRSIMESVHKKYIKPMLLELCNTQYTGDELVASDERIINYASQLIAVFTELDVNSFHNTRMNTFITTLTQISGSTAGSINRTIFMEALEADTNIKLQAFYNQNAEIQYTTDEYLTILTAPEFNALTVDEAERIKLITHYTFNSIPLEDNTSILFDYRIYAN